MPLKGNVGTSLVDKNEAEVIVNEYFNYIEDIGLSLDFSGKKDREKPLGKLDIGEIVESITKRLEDSFC